jgi:acetylornithine deacetylase/succinyl-diaminopimelate desuccinylase-like protein
MRTMLILFAACLLSLVLGCSWHDTSQATQKFDPISQTSSITPQAIIEEMINQVDQERVLTDLRRFTGVEPICYSDTCTTLNGRFTGSENLQRVKEYVYAALVDLKYSVEVLDWERSGYADQNILAHKRGVIFPQEEIYFIAHLDGYPSNGPAADDDGSGAAALIELARLLANRKLVRSLTIFFSTGEEQGTQGAHQFVEDYPERVNKIKYLVNVEMLSYDSNDDGVMELFNGNQPPDFVQMLKDIIQTYPLNLDPQIYSDCG